MNTSLGGVTVGWWEGGAWVDGRSVEAEGKWVRKSPQVMSAVEQERRGEGGGVDLVYQNYGLVECY